MMDKPKLTKEQQAHVEKALAKIMPKAKAAYAAVRKEREERKGQQ